MNYKHYDKTHLVAIVDLDPFVLEKVLQAGKVVIADVIG